MKRDEKGRFVKAAAKIAINFLGWTGRAALEIEAKTLREAVEMAGADLRGANLRGADLRGADLQSADLQSANLRGANLRGADLWGANLRGADLWGANLQSADLQSADLRGAKYGDRALWLARPVVQLGPCGSVGRQTVVYFFADNSEPLIRCGCFSGSVVEFETKIHDTHAGTFYESEYMAMVAHIKCLYAIQKEMNK